MFGGSATLGYIVIGLLAFVLGVCVTILCFRIRLLNKEGQACLLPLGQVLVRCGWEEERRTLDCTARRLEQEAGRAREERLRMGRVYQVLGLSGGAFLVILLL